MNKKYLVILAVVLGLSVFIVSDLSAGVLGVRTCYQEQTNWCWAGSSQAILKYKTSSPSQCRMANFAWGVNYCCSNPGPCNKANNLWGSGSLQDILRNWGVRSSVYSRALSYSKVKREIKSRDPFVIRWGWDSGGGHFVVGYGYSGSTIYIMDPWDGKYTGSYNWTVRGSGHSWTHSLATN